MKQIQGSPHCKAMASSVDVVVLLFVCLFHLFACLFFVCLLECFHSRHANKKKAWPSFIFLLLNTNKADWDRADRPPQQLDMILSQGPERGDMRRGPGTQPCKCLLNIYQMFITCQTDSGAAGYRGGGMGKSHARPVTAPTESPTSCLPLNRQKDRD